MCHTNEPVKARLHIYDIYFMVAHKQNASLLTLQITHEENVTLIGDKDLMSMYMYAHLNTYVGKHKLFICVYNVCLCVETFSSNI